MFIGTICVNAQVDEETKLKNRISEEKVLMDSCYKRMIDESLPEEERLKSRDLLKLYKDSYEQHLRKYDYLYNTDPNQLSKAGYYLGRSVNLKLAANCISIVGGLLTGLIVTSLIEEKDPDAIQSKKILAIGTGVITAGVSYGLSIASIIDIKRTSRIMQNIRFTGNGLSYTF